MWISSSRGSSASIPELDFKLTLDIRKGSDFAKITKDIFALSNYGGGYIIFGYNERKTGSFAPVGLPKDFLSLLFKLLPSLSPSNRVYSHDKISSLGYRKVTTLRSAISEIVSLQTN